MRRLLAGLLAASALALLPAPAAVAQSPGCEVEAQLTWGFKESFRAYIDGSIANGEWTVADGATYATPSFGFPSESGRLDPRGPGGSIAFVGSVRFTGHGGILDTTIANPVLVFRGDEALLLLDVSGPTMAGDEVTVTEAPFLAIDLRGQDFTAVDGVITLDEAPSTLTEEGAEAFPNYEAGSEFDPVSATIDVGDCDLTGQPIGTDVIEEGVIGDATPFVAIVAVLAGLLVAAAAVLVVVAVRRRR
jgi:hypothetical protein